MKQKPTIAVLASGNGSNFQAIAHAIKRGYIKADITVLITDQEAAYARQRAKKMGITDIYVNPKDYAGRQEFDQAIVKILKHEKIDIVVLAGFMRIISPAFIKAFKNKIVNVHPALLPAFKGVDSIKRAYEWGCKVAGVTVHFVDEEMDHGPIIMQESVEIKKGMSLKKLEEKIHAIEHVIFPRAIKLLAEGKLTVSNRIVKISR